jgi:hypothetical protein
MMRLSMTALDLLNLDVLLARSVLLRADYMQAQDRARLALERRQGQPGQHASEEDFDDLVAAMTRSLAADARYLCTLAITVRCIIERAKMSV